jgi:hypothetical protein
MRQTEVSPPRVPDVAAPQRRPSAPLQAQRDFDAALRRIDARSPSDDEAPEEERPDAAALAAFGALPLAQGTAALAGGGALLGAGAAAAQPAAPGAGALPEAVAHAAPGLAGAAGQQFRLSVPVEGAQPTALALRLVNTGPGHWQLRLNADTPTRQQLAPHLERLRDKLRQRGARLDDLGFDDDPGSDR